MMWSHCPEYQQEAGSPHPVLSFLQLLKFVPEETLVTKLTVMSFPKTVIIYITQLPSSS